MKLIKLAPRKHTAQAMVEFAIVLPILLVLLYGILEAGRLLFMYSTIVTASRQAVRYGSATGLGLGTTTVERYRDCTGIRQAANRADFLNAFDHTTDAVKVYWDEGPDDIAADRPICLPGEPSATWTPNNDTRLIVTVDGQFNAIVRLLPFINRKITATSARTILVSVPIEVTVPSSGTVPDTTETQLLNTSPNPSEPGQPVIISVSVSNTTGTAIPVGNVAVSDGTTVLCTITLDPTGAGTCTYSFYSDTNLTATFTPSDPAAFQASASSPPYFHDTTMVTTVVTITHTPSPSVVGENVHIVIVVSNLYGASTIPTGDIVVNVCGTLPLSSGTASCDVVLNDDITISADYSGDAVHRPSTRSSWHEVMDGTATPSNTPPPTSTPTQTPIPSATLNVTATATPTASATNVPDCISFASQFVGVPSPIDFKSDTMFLNINNMKNYPVTVNTMFVAWNQTGGSGGRVLILQSAQLNTTVFWNTPVASQNITLGGTEYPFTVPVVIPPNQQSVLTFTFNRNYSSQSGEQITITFSTPGCTEYQIQVTN